MKAILNINIIFKLVICVLLFIGSGCLSSQNYQTQDQRFGEKTILNYEYKNRYYISEIRRNHFLINIEIEEPYIVKIPYKNIPDIYPYADIEGYAIVLVRVNKSGRVKNYTIKKRAGLGLDRYVKQIIKNMNVEPVIHRGKKGSAKFLIRFVFQVKG